MKLYTDTIQGKPFAKKTLKEKNVKQKNRNLAPSADTMQGFEHLQGGKP